MEAQPVQLCLQFGPSAESTMRDPDQRERLSDHLLGLDSVQWGKFHAI